MKTVCSVCHRQSVGPPWDGSVESETCVHCRQEQGYTIGYIGPELVRTTKRDLLAGGRWDLFCALREIGNWESMGDIVLSHHEAACLGIKPLPSPLWVPSPLSESWHQSRTTDRYSMLRHIMTMPLPPVEQIEM